jgi:TonB family protein
MELAPLTVLNKRYTIKRTVSDPGPFDIQYLGEDVDSTDRFLIREYFPTHLLRRASEKTSVEVKGGDDEAELYQAGLEYYRKESSVLAELEHEAIPSGYDCFEANGTYYRARPHRPSMTLAEGLQSRGTLSEKAALTVVVPILGALTEAHDAGLYHGGVSPRTIQLLEDGKVLLTGFRGAFIQLARREGTLDKIVQDGTSAIEQYTPRGNQGPWTDVYAAAATICEVVTGRTLPPAKERLEGDDAVEAIIEDAGAFSTPGVREALSNALTVDPSDRLQSAEALSQALVEASSRYDEDAASYSILPVEEQAAADEEAGDAADAEDEGDVEVLTPAGRDDRPPASAEAGDDDAGSGSTSRTALMVGVPLLLVLLGGGGAWFLISSGGASASSDTYADYRSRADSLFANQDYREARRYYRQALEQREGDSYAQQRLERIEGVLQRSGQRQYEQRLARGDSLRRRAARLLEQGDTGTANRVYSRAMASYFSALDAVPGESEEVQQRINQVEKRQEQIARRRVSGAQGGSGNGDGGMNLDQIATFFKQQGDRQLEAGNLRSALQKYEQALEYRPNDDALQSTVTDLQNEIAAQEARRAARRSLERGRELLAEEDYAAAKSAFEEAADARPNSAAVQQALARADSLQQRQQRRQEQYKLYRSQGDDAFQQENFQAAVTAYKRALEYKPDDSYAQGQLEKARENLEEIQLARSKQEAEERQVKGPDGIYKVVDESPQVRGGLAALHDEVDYPAQAEDQGVEGRVYIGVVVNADGSVRSAEVSRGIGAGCDEEALEVVRNAEFIPATYEGETVPARTTVFIQFNLGR